MAFAEEREQMVFAKAEDFDILDDHHFIVSHIEHGSIQQLIGILFVTAGQVPQRGIDALRCLHQSVAGGIFAQLRQDVAYLINHSVHSSNFSRGILPSRCGCVIKAACPFMNTRARNAEKPSKSFRNSAIRSFENTRNAAVR